MGCCVGVALLDLILYLLYSLGVTTRKDSVNDGPRSAAVRRLSGGRLEHQGITGHGVRCGVLKKPDCAPSFNTLVKNDTLIAFHVGPSSALRGHSILPVTITMVFRKNLGLVIGPRLFFGGSGFHVFKGFACGGALRGFCNVNCTAGGRCRHDSSADRCHCDNFRVGP